MDNSTKNWYTLYTRQGSEKKVASILSRKNIENYCPVNKVKSQSTGWKKVTIEPLLTSYVFVKISENQHSTISKVDGVINFVYWLGKPAIINVEEIDVMKRFMNEHDNVKIQKLPFHVNNSERGIVNLPGENKGYMISIKNNSIKITLPSLGYIMFAELMQSNIEVIAAKIQNYPVPEKYQYAV